MPVKSCKILVKQKKEKVVYTIDLAKEICEIMSNTTDSIKKICDKYPDFPNMYTIYSWRFIHPEFEGMYMNARRNQAEILISEIIDITDDLKNIKAIDKDGNEIIVSPTMEDIAVAKLQIHAREWLAERLLAKNYGNRVVQETTVTIKHEDALKELD